MVLVVVVAAGVVLDILVGVVSMVGVMVVVGVGTVRTTVVVVVAVSVVVVVVTGLLVVVGLVVGPVGGTDGGKDISLAGGDVGGVPSAIKSAGSVEVTVGGLREVVGRT